MKNKKAQLAIPFHWIFILIAGALILLFFVSIVFKQKAVSEQKLTATLISDIEEIFTGAGVGEAEAIHVIDIPKTEFNFICEEETGVSEYNIRRTGISKPTPTEIFFTPDLVAGKQIVIWSLPWSLPFKISNFLMVSSPDVRYVIYYEPAAESFAEQIKLDMPEALTVDLIEKGDSIVDKGHYKVKFVFIDVDPTTDPTLNIDKLRKIPDKDVSAVKIESDKVRFYEKKFDVFVEAYGGDVKGRPLFLPSFNKKDTMYYVSIFAENADQYRCNLNKILKRASLVAEIYKERAERLRIYSANTDPEGVCHLLYPGSGGFASLISVAEDCLEQGLDSYACDSSTFRNSAEDIKESNTNLQDQACLLIY